MARRRKLVSLDLRKLFSERKLKDQAKDLDAPNNNPKSIRKSLCGDIIPDKIIIRVERVVWDRMKANGVLPDGYVKHGEGIYEGQLEDSISFDCAGDVKIFDFALSLFMKSARKDQESIYIEYVHERIIPAIIDLHPDNKFYIRRLSHHMTKTGARDTEDYLFSQLIPYIGNKRKLLQLITEAINEVVDDPKSSTFVDLFTGSTVVARLAKQLGFRVLCNDWEHYSEHIAIGTVKINRVPAFSPFGGADEVFERLNSLDGIEGYITQHLCPKDDENPNHDSERQFFMRKNGLKIDAMREKVELWKNQGKLTPEEFSYLIAAFMYSVSYVSNTSGVFKGFHRGWGGSNGTALYRIGSDFELKKPITYDNQRENFVTRKDAGELAGNLSKILGSIPDIVYLDPPYNQHPYGANYHVLNTVALWDKPAFPKEITRGTKAAIRTDWRTERRSAYNYKNRAADEFRELIESIEAKFILTSYSTEGNMDLHDLISILGSKGSLIVKKQEYVRYRVSSTRPSPKPRNVEFVIITDTNSGPETEENIEKIVADLRHIDSQIPESDDVLPKGQRTMDMYDGKGQRAIEQFDENKKVKNYKCGKCGESGHNSRTCGS